jgi:hypothetical protein
MIPIGEAEGERIVAEVEALYAGEGPPPRTTSVVRADDGTERIRLGGLFIECAACHERQPQSRSRQSPDARRQWVRMHLACLERPAET